MVNIQHLQKWYQHGHDCNSTACMLTNVAFSLNTGTVSKSLIFGVKVIIHKNNINIIKLIEQLVN